MEDDVEAYVKTCIVCQQNKIERKKEFGLLHPLPILNDHWILMDFINRFPKVNELNFVMVVDRLSKYAVFIAAPSDVVGELFYKTW